MNIYNESLYKKRKSMKESKKKIILLLRLLIFLTYIKSIIVKTFSFLQYKLMIPDDIIYKEYIPPEI